MQPAAATRGHAERARRSVRPGRYPLIVAGSFLIAALAVAPIVALVVIALGGDASVWPHLIGTILPASTLTTVLLMLGVGVLTSILGVAGAWLVTMCRFPGRGMLEWMLLLPLAVPTYVVAYCYVEILDSVGPVQTLIRSIFGFETVRDYWFPEIRSLGGAIFVMSFVLYPYVYLTVRATFLMQSMCVLDVSRTLGQGAIGSFFRIALPLARPAVVVGVTLALMECLNDIGAVQFLGVQTLTLSVYATWTNRGDLAGAAQIACVMLIVVLLLVWLERRGRRLQRFHHTSQRVQALPDYPLGGWRAAAAITVCSLPVLLGFVAPAWYLLSAAWRRFGLDFGPAYFTLTANSVGLSLTASAVAVLAAIILAYATRLTGSKLVAALSRLASVGYAVPGTVLAVGILIPLASLDNAIDGLARTIAGVSTGLLLTGSTAALVYAYAVRFLAVSHGTVEAGLQRVTPNIDLAARSLGRTPAGALREIHMPLLRPAIATAALLVFVDSMKELPATMLLRPFNFETLATHVYTYASMEMVEQGAIAALTIVVAGLLPVALLSRTSRVPRRVLSGAVRGTVPSI
ncbi:iron ABC transporter permease [Microbaculum marinum]|uniref:Iron ABC transporter permease n=1 Tax=Microbaculum marinum TaxID=1764581 RepID=A0AAW9RNW4_9HYPH